MSSLWVSFACTAGRSVMLGRILLALALENAHRGNFLKMRCPHEKGRLSALIIYPTTMASILLKP